jgi:HD superfamily phosphodiesterase
MTTSLYNIDESHGLSHSMNVFLMANDIYRHEVINTPILRGQQQIIYTSAILHDTCDHKYMDKEEGLERIREFLHLCTFQTPT